MSKKKKRSGSEIAAALSRLRWAKASEADRQRCREVGKLGGRPRSGAPRCACGAMTAKRALARAHKCQMEAIQK